MPFAVLPLTDKSIAPDGPWPGVCSSSIWLPILNRALEFVTIRMVYDRVAVGSALGDERFDLTTTAADVVRPVCVRI